MLADARYATLREEIKGMAAKLGAARNLDVFIASFENEPVPKALGWDQRPIPRKSGTTTVRLPTSVSANGAHISPGSPKPCSMTTADPSLPIRTWSAAPSVLILVVRKANGPTSSELPEI
jgi:hypothetical protein